ncbi:hypothetical protein DFS34DRAFT_628705 [Phlyctochytrium arcticum]|nr:hypothetical protein DFS34DRAFT_628705 [Phlyctochytrium arcticum]
MNDFFGNIQTDYHHSPLSTHIHGTSSFASPYETHSANNNVLTEGGQHPFLSVSTMSMTSPSYAPSPPLSATQSAFPYYGQASGPNSPYTSCPTLSSPLTPQHPSQHTLPSPPPMDPQLQRQQQMLQGMYHSRKSSYSHLHDGRARHTQQSQQLYNQPTVLSHYGESPITPASEADHRSSLADRRMSKLSLDTQLPYFNHSNPNTPQDSNQIYSAHPNSGHSDSHNNEEELEGEDADNDETDSGQGNDGEDDSKGGSRSRNKKTFPCDLCGRRFTRNYNLREHMQVHDSIRVRRFHCTECPRSYFRSADLSRHRKSQHAPPILLCICGAAFRRPAQARRHQSECMRRLLGVNPGQSTMQQMHASPNNHSSNHMMMMGHPQTIVPSQHVC